MSWRTSGRWRRGDSEPHRKPRPARCRGVFGLLQIPRDVRGRAASQSTGCVPNVDVEMSRQRHWPPPGSRTRFSVEALAVRFIQHGSDPLRSGRRDPSAFPDAQPSFNADTAIPPGHTMPREAPSVERNAGRIGPGGRGGEAPRVDPRGTASSWSSWSRTSAFSSGRAQPCRGFRVPASGRSRNDGDG